MRGGREKEGGNEGLLKGGTVVQRVGNEGLGAKGLIAAELMNGEALLTESCLPTRWLAVNGRRYVLTIDLLLTKYPIL